MSNTSGVSSLNPNSVFMDFSLFGFYPNSLRGNNLFPIMDFPQKSILNFLALPKIPSWARYFSPFILMILLLTRCSEDIVRFTCQVGSKICFNSLGTALSLFEGRVWKGY
jgi:hypothetical protein